MSPAAGLVIAAPASGSGKTIVTLALLRALRQRGLAVASAKVGPDYIDPAFHAAASGRPCLNLDGWAMRPATIAGHLGALADQAELILCEGVMGLFDGALVAEGQNAGSTADMAALLGWPVILLVDLKGQAASAAALVEGFRRHRSDIRIAGVLFNRVGSTNHRIMVERACRAACPDLALLGWLPTSPALALPDRHLGLVPAGETGHLESRLEAAAALIAQHVDLHRLIDLARPSGLAPGAAQPPLAPLGRHIAVARDAAFAFAYPAVLDGWRQAGTTLSWFSPLADQAPDATADAVFLPGGYPELHGGRLAAADAFLGGLRAAAARGAWIYGECGGYMVLGDAIEDADGLSHRMAGLLPVTTSFAQRRLHLGYRRLCLAADTPLGQATASFRGHEFHYSSITAEAAGNPLFLVSDAAGRPAAAAGRIDGRVMGSFMHLVDAEAD